MIPEDKIKEAAIEYAKELIKEYSYHDKLPAAMIKALALSKK